MSILSLEVYGGNFLTRMIQYATMCMWTYVHIHIVADRCPFCQGKSRVTKETSGGSWSANLPKVLGTRPRHERRDAMEHRQRILQVAQHLFALHGVGAVSMHQIAKAAGIGQGTLYRRYAHKGDLCMDLLCERHERLIEDIAALFEKTKNFPVLERLEGVMAQCIAFLEEQGALLGPVLRERQEMLCSDVPSSSQNTSFYVWLHTLFAGLLTEAVERGELVDLDITFTADAMLATLNPMFYRLQRQERGLSPERILQGLRRIYIKGINT